MGKVELLLPKLGESVMEATILSWLKKEGDTIEEEESLVEVATDKVDTEVPSSYAGKIEKILVQEGEVAQVGKPIALISTDQEMEPDEENIPPAPTTEESYLQQQHPEASNEVATDSASTRSNGAHHNEASKPAISQSRRFYSPLVKSIAKEEQIGEEELAAVQGTGMEGRVTKYDILNYLENRKKPGFYAAQGSVSDIKDALAHPALTPDIQLSVSPGAGDEVIEMDRMRKMIAQRMVDSKRIAPHVTSFVEADVTNIVVWRNRHKTEFKEKEGDSLTFTPIFIEAVVKAIKDYPMINITVDGDRIIKKSAINIGMAVALPSGNLIVPVIHHADQMNLIGLTKKVNDYARRARGNKLKPDELSGGTYTISNVGSFGNVMGTPIIMQPQVGIMALGAVVKKPAVVETPTGDAIAIRYKMFLSHSYDHRVVDGSLGGMFVRRVADYLERFDVKRALY